MIKKLLFTFLFVLGLIAINTNAYGQEMLSGTNMESSAEWNISRLDTPVDSVPIATWNQNSTIPSSGIGGNLHVTGTTSVGGVQYCIYQAVHLSSDSVYTFDGVFYALQINNSWCEVFIGVEPIDGEEYNDEDGTNIANFGTWSPISNTDGTFQADANGVKYFIPETTGDYYFVLKMGSTSWDNSVQTFETILDELSLMRTRSKPFTAFSADTQSGFAPLSVNFTDESKFATSWLWSFGDGVSTTDQNPSYVYNVAGTYTVSLTATNEQGDSVLAKTDYIVANDPVSVVAGGVVTGGELEDQTDWGISDLNTPLGSEAVASWNELVKVTTAGTGGCLNVTGLSNNNTVQYCIYQAVDLDTDSLYIFDAAIKDFTTGLNQAWVEVYIGTQPVDGLDYGNGEGTRITEFSTWSTECSHAGIDGTFGNDACMNGNYVPPTDGTYYLVIKIGSTSWAGDDMPFDVSIDEISFTSYRVKPFANFSVDNPLGFAPLSVQFTDESNFAASWAWDFGDGGSSTDQNPSYSYSSVGTYSVTLTATNEKGDSVLTKTDFIKVNELPTLPPNEKLYGGNMEDPNLWNITQLNSTAVTTGTWNYTGATPADGEGGNLHLSSTIGGGQTAQYCIWQAVEMKADSVYNFDAAFMDLTGVNQFWSEVFIGDVAPQDGSDYSPGTGIVKIAFFNTWDCGTSVNLDGTYAGSACVESGNVGEFRPPTDGTYYFAIKTGSWEGGSFEVIIDEVTLLETTYVAAPVADFFADVTSGDAPLTVYFTDLSDNTSEWEWTFGDGGTSTDQHPSYTYTTPGVYSVSLTAKNDDLFDVMDATDLITVTSSSSIDDLTEGNILVYPSPSKGMFNINMKDISKYNMTVLDITGKEVNYEIMSTGSDEIKLDIKNKGLYFIRIHAGDNVIMKKILIQ